MEAVKRHRESSSPYMPLPVQERSKSLVSRSRKNFRTFTHSVRHFFFYTLGYHFLY